MKSNKKIVLIVFVVILLAGCESKNTDMDIDALQPEGLVSIDELEELEEIEKLNEEIVDNESSGVQNENSDSNTVKQNEELLNIKAEIDSKINNLKIEYDQYQDSYTLYDENYEIALDSNYGMMLQLNEDNQASLAFLMMYVGEDMIFVDEFIILTDSNRYQYEFPAFASVEREFGLYQSIEMFFGIFTFDGIDARDLFNEDELLFNTDIIFGGIDVFNDIAYSSNVSVKLYGSAGSKEIILSEKEREQTKNLLALYELVTENNLEEYLKEKLKQ